MLTAYLVPIVDERTGETILYDIFVYEEQDYYNAAWHGSRRTLEQAQNYLRTVQ